jgi:hypothetical protein
LPVDPNDLLIFKMRGMKAKPRKEARPSPARIVKPAPQQRPQPEEVIAPAPAVVAPVQAAAQPQKARAKQQNLNLEAEQAAALEERSIKVSKAPKEQIKPEEEISASLSSRLYGYTPEPEIREEPRAPEKTGKLAMFERRRNYFSSIAGLLFIINAAFFSYYIYPQSIFIVNYIHITGLSFFNSYNYNYDSSLANLMLVVFSFLGGLLMFAKGEKTYLFNGIVTSFVILVVTFEYLSSPSTLYLLIVSALAFVGIGALAYSSMTTANIAEEREEMTPEEIEWPSIETF